MNSPSAPRSAAGESRVALHWLVAALIALVAGFGAIQAARFYLERDHQESLALEAKRRAVEIMAATMNGNVMGSVAALGLVNQPVKRVARGEIPLQDPGAMDVLRAVGESYGANGVYVVSRDGRVQSNWYTIGRALTGVDVRFRPYFQIAMQGKQNVYAAIGTTTGERALYFAAPLYAEANASSPVIGATVARLDIERVDSVLKAWRGPALLLSPQQITFASNRAEWVERIARETTPQQLDAIRALKQFGNTFESGTPATLPFAAGLQTVGLDNRRYAVSRAPVQWNDPHGEWTLLLLDDLGALLSVRQRALIGIASAALAFALCAFFLVWRGRLQHAELQRGRADSELRAHATRLEMDSSTKSYLAELSADLQRTGSTAEFAQKLMFHLAPRVEATYGEFYVLDDASALLTPVGGYGAGDLPSVALGQGLVGQCARDRSVIVVSDAAQSAIRISWSSAAIVPKALILLPIVQTERLLGVIVLAGLHEFDAGKRALLDAMLSMIAMNLDILLRHLETERQAQVLEKQQTQLKETEAWYRGIIELAPDGMLVIDDQGTIILANQRIDAMFGYPAGALVGQKIEVLVPASVRGRHVALRDGFIRTGTARAMGVGLQLRGVRRDGSEFPVEVGLSNLPALGGRSFCSCASVRDVTERNQAGEDLAQERARLQHILDTSPVAVGFTCQGRIRLANPAFVETFGLGEGDPSPNLYVNPADRDMVIERLKRDGVIKNHELQMFDKHHRPRDMVITFLPINYAGEDGILGWVMDVTERKQRA